MAADGDVELTPAERAPDAVSVDVADDDATTAGRRSTAHADAEVDSVSVFLNGEKRPVYLPSSRLTRKEFEDAFGRSRGLVDITDPERPVHVHLSAADNRIRMEDQHFYASYPVSPDVSSTSSFLKAQPVNIAVVVAIIFALREALEKENNFEIVMSIMALISITVLTALYFVQYWMVVLDQSGDPEVDYLCCGQRPQHSRSCIEIWMKISSLLVLIFTGVIIGDQGTERLDDLEHDMVPGK